MVNHCTTVKDVPAFDFINAYAKHLKRGGKIEIPKWTEICKTAKHKELAPYDPDWFYVRAASVARKLYIRSGTGVGAFRKVYGGKNRRGTCKSRFSKASGNVIRTVLKQLEAIKVVEKDSTGGRKMTSEGQRDLDRIAGQVAATQAPLIIM